ncbi:DUF4817 domain-containing protein [Trichonephila clavipes]|nr:DUF4817 domain-containing protein [Trichonephila clavipes]
MTTSKQKVFCVLRLTKTEFSINVQRAFRVKFGCQPPNDNSILRWYHQFETTVCLCKGKNLSPIEKVRFTVAERLVRHQTPVIMVDELWHRVETVWASVPVHAIQSLFDSMSKRISAVIIARGGRLGY